MNSAKRLALALGLIAGTLSWFSGAEPVFACSCAMSTPEEYFDDATTVFTGTASSITYHGMRKSVDFNLGQVLKGPAREKATVITGQGDGDCGISFEIGQEYIVYTHGDDELSTDICNGTMLLAVAGDDSDEPSIVATVEPGIETETPSTSPSTMVIVVVLAFGAGVLTAYLMKSKKAANQY